MQHNTEVLSGSIGIPYPGVEQPSEFATVGGCIAAVLGARLEFAPYCTVPALSGPSCAKIETTGLS